MVPRVGIAVSGARTAVQRNRARRVMRAAVAPVLPETYAIDMVLTVVAGDAMSVDHVSGDVRRVLEEVGTLLKRP
jgi:ribonuclease P protein component